MKRYRKMRQECTNSTDPQFWVEFLKVEMKLLEEEPSNDIVFSWLGGSLRTGEFEAINAAADTLKLEICTDPCVGSGVVRLRGKHEKK